MADRGASKQFGLGGVAQADRVKQHPAFGREHGDHVAAKANAQAERNAHRDHAGREPYAGKDLAKRQVRQCGGVIANHKNRVYACAMAVELASPTAIPHLIGSLSARMNLHSWPDS